MQKTISDFHFSFLWVSLYEMRNPVIILHGMTNFVESCDYNYYNKYNSKIFGYLKRTERVFKSVYGYKHVIIKHCAEI